MSFIVYGGIKYIQVRHAIYCKKCKDTIESTSVHDYKLCSCGAVGIDGGILAGNHVLGDKSNMETRSIYMTTINRKKICLSPNIIEEHFNSSY